MGKSGKDSLLGNKIAAGVLTAGLILWGANRVAHIFIPGEAPEKPAIQLTGLTPATPMAAPSGPESIIPLLASADAAKGQAFVQQQCAACHTLTPGGANGVGPNLYGVLGGPMFAHAGFAYSDAVKAKAKGSWDYDSMDSWLTSPSGFASGTGMSYAGIHNPQTRADVIVYLRSLAASPLPIPAAPAASAAAPAQAAAPASAPGIDTLFASADATKGQAMFQQQCSVCHSIAKGSHNGVGPDLYGVVGAKAFSAPGFTYSSAVMAKAGQPWTPDSLSDWLKAPNSYASGTAMSFAGIKNDQIRADVIAYLNHNSDSPAKLP